MKEEDKKAKASVEAKTESKQDAEALAAKAKVEG